ncbi:Beta-fructofuranosidase, insoluble isoenzyme 4 [Dichanthelium oligosanthes]|uniref:Beta-fructofuranosidase, insoluble isoenzyme 4 n=1 Tax=Dichanthelium oligosanthes TaxID=888268 RepID=A0A1E5UPN4_9POAL|nr:Beta-fructofuranosidase, insoluble isoenzyme 4 [Dichanthelium oligosanthes]
MAALIVLRPWAFLLFLVLVSYDESGLESSTRNGIAQATQRVFLYPQSPKVSSIVSTKYRTAYHFQPPKNWINGPMYYNGIYHQFYQYNPNGSLWGNIVWGHSVSTDLINWIRLEPAIERTTPSDINGCWTGSATILKGDRPAIIYTGADTEKRQVQNIVFPKNVSDPYLREWIKPDNNPLIQPVGQGLNSNQFRDPTTGWIGPDGLWRIAVGAELNGYSAALLFKSEDFVHWTRVDHPLYSSNASTMWECPDFFAVLPGKNSGLDLSAAIPNGAKHVLKMSLDNCDKYMVGVYDLKSDTFVPDTELDDQRLWSRIDYGNYYASKSFFDSKRGRRIIWGWTNETDSSSDDVAKGWAGIHVSKSASSCITYFPLNWTIWLDSNSKQLLQWPVEEIESLRREELIQHMIFLKQADVEIHFELTSIDSADPFDPSWLLDIEKHCQEADASVHGSVGPFGLVVLASDNMEEHTSVHFRVYKSKEKYMVLMCSDLRKSSLRPELYTPAYGGFFEFNVEKENTISLRTLIDRSAVESFGGGGRVCIMARVYPVTLINGGTRMHAFNNGTGTVKVPQLKAWSMRRAQVNVKKE